MLSVLLDKKSWKVVFHTVLNNIAVIWRFLILYKGHKSF